MIIYKKVNNIPGEKRREKKRNHIEQEEMITKERRV